MMVAHTPLLAYAYVSTCLVSPLAAPVRSDLLFSWYSKSIHLFWPFFVTIGALITMTTHVLCFARMSNLDYLFFLKRSIKTIIYFCTYSYVINPCMSRPSCMNSTRQFASLPSFSASLEHFLRQHKGLFFWAGKIVCTLQQPSVVLNIFVSLVLQLLVVICLTCLILLSNSMSDRSCGIMM